MKVSENQVNIERSGEMLESSFGISEGNEAHILMILRDKLYSDKIGAVVREYSTNALDSHVEAGKPDVPIQIKLPNDMEPMFCVVDDGVGLSEEEVRNIYVQYGASTKRNSNSVIGQLGLGCKSAFAYADNFNIVSRKEGKKKTYSAYLDETKCGKVALLVEEETSETDGVEIQIPVRKQDFHNFKDTVKDKLKYMTPLPEVDGHQLKEEITYSLETTINGNRVGLREGHGRSNLVMGSIAYPFDFSKICGSSAIPEDIREMIRSINGKRYDVYVNIGDVDISANRETLEYTDRTCVTIANGLNGLIEVVKKELKDKLDKCTTLKEAKEFATKNTNLAKQYGFKLDEWNNKTFDLNLLKSFWVDGSTFAIPLGGGAPIAKNYNCTITEIDLWYNRAAYADRYQISISSYDHKKLFFEVDNTSAWKSKVSRWIRENNSAYKGINYNSFFGVNFHNDTDAKEAFFKKYGLNDYEWLKVSDLKLTKAPRKKNGDGSIKRMSHHGKMFTLKPSDQRLSTVKSEDWERITGGVSKGRKYYVELDRFKITGNSKVDPSTIDNLCKLLKAKGRDIQPCDIIGIKTAHIKHRHSGWIPLMKFAKKILDNDTEIRNYLDLKYSIANTIRRKDIEGILREKHKLKKKNSIFYKSILKLEKRQNQSQIYQDKFGLSTNDIERIFTKARISYYAPSRTDDTEIQKIYEDIAKEYPMLEDASIFPNHSWDINCETATNKTINYVNMHEAWNKEKRKNEIPLHFKRRVNNTNHRWTTKGRFKR